MGLQELAFLKCASFPLTPMGICGASMTKWTTSTTTELVIALAFSQQTLNAFSS